MSSFAVALGEAHAVKCELAGDVLRSSGALRLRVMGWSMFPSIRPGDTLVIHGAGRNAVSQGDVVLFRRDRRLFVHRVVSKGGQLVTQGDSMSAPDPPVPESDLLGTVSFIIRNGKCIQPKRTLRVPERVAANLFQRSEFAARVVVGVHGRLQTRQNELSIARADG